MLIFSCWALDVTFRERMPVCCCVLLDSRKVWDMICRGKMAMNVCVLVEKKEEGEEMEGWGGG